VGVLVVSGCKIAEPIFSALLSMPAERLPCSVYALVVACLNMAYWIHELFLWPLNYSCWYRAKLFFKNKLKDGLGTS
jgi:hypothetical protein